MKLNCGAQRHHYSMLTVRLWWIRRWTFDAYSPPLEGSMFSLFVERRDIMRGSVSKIFLQYQAVHLAGKLVGQKFFKSFGTLTHTDNINTGDNSQ